jgi:hypothetical protein
MILLTDILALYLVRETQLRMSNIAVTITYLPFIVWLRNTYVNKFQLIILNFFQYVYWFHVVAVVGHGHDTDCAIKFNFVYDLLPQW